MGIYRNSNNKLNLKLIINKNITLKSFFFSVKKSERIYKFNYLFLDFNRFNNGNSQIFLYFFGINTIIYINGLSENKQFYKNFINY